MKHGFVKVAAASPMIRVADAEYNAQQVIASMKEANEKGVKVLVFPELVLTGCTCYDLYTQRTLLNGAEKALAQVIKASEDMDVLAFVGLPFLYETRLYSCAAAVYDGELLGMVPRTHVKGTHFVPADDQVRDIIVDGTYGALMMTDLLFVNKNVPDMKIAVELGADRDAIVPPSVKHAVAGATVIAQLASFPMTVSSRTEAEASVKYQSERTLSGVICASPNKLSCQYAHQGRIL